MDKFDDVKDICEFDRALRDTSFSPKGKGCNILTVLLPGTEVVPGTKPLDGVTKDQLLILLRTLYRMVPVANEDIDKTRSRFDSSGSSVGDMAAVDFLRESFDKLKQDLLGKIEQKVEDKMTQLLQTGSGKPVVEEKAEPAPPMKRYVDIKLDGGDSSSPISSKEQWSQFVRPKVEDALKKLPVLHTVVSKDSVRLSFQTEDQLKEAQGALSPALGQDVQIFTEKRKMIDPKITINDLDDVFLDNEALLKAEIVSDKNEEIKRLHDQGGTVKVVHVNKRNKFAVLQVSPEIRKCILNKKDKIFLRLRQHFVRDRFHAIQCFHCQEFGHVASSLRCSRKDGPPVCAFCSGEHETRQCDHKKRNDMSKMMCVNCHCSSNKEDKRHSKSHLASSTLCPFYVNERAKLMERTAGVTKESKNVYRTRAMEELRQKRLGGLVR